jgi:transcriptional regulator with XRE-family HTH domain
MPAASSEIVTDRCVALTTLIGNDADMLSERVAGNIKRAREAKGLSQQKLAQRCSPPTVYQQIDKLETGERRLTFDWVERIAGALKMDPIALITDQEPMDISLSEQVSNEVARILGRVALQGEEPAPGTIQALSLILQELTATFARHPQAYRDPAVALPVADSAARRFGPLAS